MSNKISMQMEGKTERKGREHDKGRVALKTRISPGWHPCDSCHTSIFNTNPNGGLGVALFNRTEYTAHQNPTIPSHSQCTLCVGLLFSLAADLEHARPELQVSQSSRSALRGKGWSRPVCLSVAPSCPPRPALREREVITDGVGCCRRWYRQRRCAG